MAASPSTGLSENLWPPRTETQNDTDHRVHFEQAVTACTTTERGNFMQIAAGQIGEIFGRAKLRYKTIPTREEQENKIALLSKATVNNSAIKV